MSEADQQFSKLFIPLQGELLAFIISRGVPPHDAEDVLQDVARALIAKFDAFQTGTDFRAWAYSVIRFEVLRYFKRGRRPLIHLNHETLEQIENVMLDESQALDTEALRRGIDGLGDTEKDLVKMRYNDGFSVKDMASKLGRPVDSVYTSLSRVRNKLKVFISKFEKRNK